MIKNGKTVHKKNKFLLFLFLCLFRQNLSYICLCRDVAALMNEENEHEKDFDLYDGSVFMPDSGRTG